MEIHGSSVRRQMLYDSCCYTRDDGDGLIRERAQSPYNCNRLIRRSSALSCVADLSLGQG